MIDDRWFQTTCGGLGAAPGQKDTQSGRIAKALATCFGWFDWSKGRCVFFVCKSLERVLANAAKAQPVDKSTRTVSRAEGC